MAQEVLRSGLGYVDGGRRYGYTDGTLWYLGEIRLFHDASNANQITALSYSQLKQSVDNWIAANPATRATYPTSDETKVSLGFSGNALGAKHEYYYQNYFFIGKPDPQPYPRETALVQLFSNPALGITGVGLGYADGRFSARSGYSDPTFWYKGEARIFRIAQLPASVTQITIPPNGPPAATGIKYYRGADGYTYVTGPANDSFILLEYTTLRQLVDNWESSNRKILTGGDWLSSGFLWMGQAYWQSQGYQCLPDDFAVALNDPERNLKTIMDWLPGTKPLGGSPASGNFTVELPRAQQLQGQGSIGGSLGDLALLRYLLNTGGGSKKRKKKNKRGR